MQRDIPTPQRAPGGAPARAGASRQDPYGADEHRGRDAGRGSEPRLPATRNRALLAFAQGWETARHALGAMAPARRALAPAGQAPAPDRSPRRTSDWEFPVPGLHERRQDRSKAAGRGPTLQRLYDELAERDRELARLRGCMQGLRRYALGGEPGGSAERRPFDLMAAVQSALCATQTELRGVIVSVRVEPLVVHGSPAAIAQVLAHLLVNAAQAMHATGRPAVIHIDAARAGTRVRVRVSDNGRGLAPAVLQRIFEPFFTTAGPGLGMGLGLTISSAIVRTHGGVLACSNRAPHGARFFFDLARAADHAAGGADAPHRHGQPETAP